MTDVLSPAVTQARLPQRLFQDFRGGDRVIAELVLAAFPCCSKVHHVHVAVAAALELPEVGLADSATAVIAALVTELMAVGSRDAVKRCHGPDAVSHDRNGVSSAGEAHVLGRHRREVLAPGGSVQFTVQTCIDYVWQCGDAATFTAKRCRLPVSSDKAVGVVESHGAGGTVSFLVHCQLPSRFWVLGVQIHLHHIGRNVAAAKQKKYLLSTHIAYTDFLDVYSIYGTLFPLNSMECFPYFS